MSRSRIDFIKGHMGGNRILLLDGQQIPRERTLTTALKALDDLGLSGHQAGILMPPERGGTVRARVVSVCGRDFIPACGGLTQVLSRALVDSPLARKFPPTRDGEVERVDIEFDSLNVTTEIHRNQDGADRIDTDFTSFAQDMVNRGIEKVDLGGFYGWRVGYFFVLEAGQVQRQHPNVDFTLMDDTARNLITLLQYRFLGSTGLTSWDFALFDRNTENGGDLRVVFPHNLRIGFIEPSCGTGSLATALAIHAAGLDESVGQTADGRHTLRLETGGKPVLGGPDITTVTLEHRDDQLVRAVFSNNRVELVASGSIDL